ncbi:hypothetical protein AKO1_002469 [Acrasis kona]|uniref:Uncharacterized protein n=1 Tax=Acrasis kona TaxID=1008807 RepID=A0AAW2ZN75_9EUKA
MKYLIIKEIVPFHNKHGYMVSVQTRVHAVIKNMGEYKFPTIEHSPKTTIKEAVEYYGLSSYFLFHTIIWKQNEVIVHYNRYDLTGASEDAQKMPPSGHHIVSEEHDQDYPLSGFVDQSKYSKLDSCAITPLYHTFLYSENAMQGFEYLSLGKKFFEKVRFHGNHNKFGKQGTRTIGATYELSLSNIAPQI